MSGAFLLLLIAPAICVDIETLRVRNLNLYQDNHRNFWKLCERYLNLRYPTRDECETSIMQTTNKTALHHLLNGMNLMNEMNIYRLRGKALAHEALSSLRYIYMCRRHFTIPSISGREHEALAACYDYIMDCVNPRILQNFIYLINK